MKAGSSINVKNYFQHSMLTPVPGTLIYGILVQLQKEVRAKGKYVPSIPGGGVQGHLGLVTYAATYAQISPNDVFTYPSHPGALV